MTRCEVHLLRAGACTHPEAMAREGAGLKPAVFPAMAGLIVHPTQGPVLFDTGYDPAFLAACRETYGLAIEGLMCIPPADEPPGPHFALLRKLAGRNGLAKLSMGMSGDFETAIGFGATSVRVGSAVFGSRG